MDKTVLVTGSARGIGKEIIIEFAKHNYNVVINYLTSEIEAFDLKKYVEKKYDIKALCIRADVTSDKDVKSMINEVNNNFKSIDVLINNAVYENDDTYLNKEKEDFLKTFEVNVYGPFNMIKEVSKYMNEGTIINISSLDSTETYSDINFDYSASKAALNVLTKSMSLAIPNIKFISVLLPWVNTESTRSMLPDYLEKELKRTNQNKLMEEKEVAEKIYNLVNSDIKSGNIERI